MQTNISFFDIKSIGKILTDVAVFNFRNKLTVSYLKIRKNIEYLNNILKY